MSNINALLYGGRPFYRGADYQDSAKELLISPHRSPIVFESGLNEDTAQAPSFLSRITASLTTSQILPATSIYRSFHREQINIDFSEEMKYLRLTLKGYGLEIDAIIKGSLENRRFLLYSPGNAELAETVISSHFLDLILKTCQCNLLVANYPGVGCSSGKPNQRNAIKAYKVALALLKEIAEEEIHWGFSIGGAISAEALKDYDCEGKFVFLVKDHTFGEFSGLIRQIFCGLGATAAAWAGWTLSPITAYRPDLPEIILQSAVELKADLTNPDAIVDDGVIPKEASLAYALLKRGTPLEENKSIIGMPDRHNEKSDTSAIVIGLMIIERIETLKKTPDPASSPEKRGSGCIVQ